MKKRLLSLLLCCMSAVVAFSAVTYQLNEGFESGIPASWSQVKVSGAHDWEAESTNLTYPSTAFEGNGRVAFRNTTGMTQGYVTKLVTPTLNLPTGAQYQLKFAYASAADNGDVDSLVVYYSANDGATWTRHTAFGDAQAQWKEVSLDLIGNGAAYRLAFEAKEKQGHGVVLDAVRVFAKSQCQDVENFSADPRANSAMLSWSGDFGVNFQLAVDSVQRDPSTFDMSTAMFYEQSALDEVTVNGLLPATTYYAYVRSLCDDNESGYTEWQSIQFTTTLGFPYTADFSTRIPADWQNLYGSLADAFNGTLPVVNPSTTYTWKYSTNTTVTGKAHVCGQTHYTTSGYVYTPAWLVSPAIDITSVEEGTAIELSFRMGIFGSSTLKTELSSSYKATTFFHLLVSTDGGESWQEANKHTYPATNFSTSMQRIRVNLSEFVGVASSLKFAFVAESNSTSAYFHLDDVTLHEFDAQCGDVKTLAFSDILANSAKAVWTLSGKDDVTIQLSKSANFATLVFTDSLSVPAHEMVFADLDHSTTYYVRVRQNCPDAEWVSGSFTTAFAVPFVQNFDALTSGIPAGWDNSEGTVTSDGYKWNYYVTGKTGHCVRFNSFSAQVGQDDWLVTPTVMVGNEPAKLSFDYKNPTGGNFKVFYSIDNGVTRVPLDSIGQVADWTTYSYYLPATVCNQSLRIYFYGVSNYGNGDAYLYLDNVVLRMYDPNCTGLTGFIANADINDAVLSWTIGGTTHEALVHVSTNKNFTDTVAYEAVSGVDTLLVNGLSASTLYYARAYQNCGDFDWSDALSVSFKTHCDADTIPYLYGFEDDAASADPGCWTIVRASGNFPNVISGTTYPHTGTKCLTYGTASAQQKSIAALPAFTLPVNQLEMSFWLRAYNASCTNTLEVGVMTNPLDESTFVRVATFQTKSTTYEKQTVSFDIYQGTGKYIVFRNPATGKYGFIIDDIDVHVLPTCYKMGDLTLNNITSNGVTINFAPTNAADYRVLVTKVAIDPDTLVNVPAEKIAYNELINNITGSIVLSEPTYLTPNTQYYIYMRGECSATEAGAWSKGEGFVTLCSAFTPAQFGIETFSNPDDNACWSFGFTVVPEGASSSSAYADAMPVTGFGSAIRLSKEAKNTTTTSYKDGAYAITPEFDVDSIKHYQITFDAATNNTVATNVHKLVVSVVSSPDMLDTKEDIATLNLAYASDSTKFKEYSISLAAYEGDYEGNFGRYVMFQSVAGEDSTNYVIVDNVRLELLSSCAKVNEAEMKMVTEDGGLFAWENTGAAQYEVLVSTINTKSVDTISNPVLTELVSADSLLISGLEGNTQYYAYVRSVCGAEETSTWSSAVAFRTECTAITTFPWAEDFETFATGNLVKDCWTNEHILGSDTYVFQVVTTTEGGNTTKKLILPDMQVGNQTRLTLPLMNIPEANAFEFGIDMYRVSGTKPLEGIIVLAEYGQTCDTLLWIPRAYQVSTATVDAEATTGWYTYTATIPFAGNGHIVLIGYSEYGNYSSADNLYIREMPKCDKPKAIVVDSITETSARVHWSGSAAEFEFILMNGNAVVDSVILTDTVYNFTGLESGTSYAYTLSLRGICGADSSDVVEKALNFNTVCGVKSLPYAESFDNLASGIPACWDNEAGTITTSSYRWNLYATGYTGKCVRMNSYNADSGQKDTLRTPEIQLSENPAELRFYAKNPTGGAFSVSVRTEDGDSVLVASISGVSTWTEYACDLTALAGELVTFSFNGTSNYGDGDAYLYLDEVRVRELPTCFPGSNLHVVDSLASQTTAGFGWTPNSADNLNAHVIVKNGQVVVVDSIVNDTVFTLTGLEASHRYNYTVEIRTICGTDESVDALTASMMFETECVAVSTLPWAYNFASVESTSLPVCWTAVKKSGTYPNVSTSMHALYMYGGGSTSSIMVALPEMTTPLNKLTLTMQYQAPVNSTYSTYGKLIVGTLDETMAESSFVALDTLDQVGSKTDYELVLAAAPADAKYLAVRYALGTSSGSAYIYKVALDVTPSCLPLKNLEATNVERRTLDIVITPKLPSDAYDLVISTVALSDSALNVAEKISLDTTVYHAEGLTRNTLYYIYARANCGSEDGVGPWMAITATTKPLGPDCSESTPADVLTTGAGSAYAPVGCFYNSSYVEQIYTADELHAAGLNAGYVSSVAFQYILSSAYTKTVTLYLGTTGDSQVSASNGFYLPAQVSDAQSVTFNTANKWYEFELTTPIYWDGSSNLVVGMLAMGSSYWNTGVAGFAGGNTTNNTVLYRRSDYDNPLTGMTTAPSTSMNRADIRLSICPMGAACAEVKTISHELLGDGTSSARIAWTASTGDYANSYSVVYADSLITDWENVVPQIDSIQALDTVISGLEAYTDYYVYVITHCDGEGHNDGSSQWSEAYHFKTLSSCLVVEDLSFAATGKTSALATWSAPYADKNFVYVLADSALEASVLDTIASIQLTDTFLVLSSLEYAHDYYLYVAHNCGAVEGISPYVSAMITTSASCPAVENLHAVTTTPYTVQVAWNRAPFGEENEWEVGVVGRESVAQIVTDSTALVYGLDPDMNYTIYVKAICGVGEESVAASLPIHTQEAVSGGITVADGTSTSSSLPVYGSYVDNGVYSESMYLASMLEDLVGGSIAGVKYYPSSDASWSGATFNVYLQETDVDDENDFNASVDSVVLVYQGELSPSAADGMQIDFIEPYTYSGRNLVIIFSQTAPGTTQSVSFKGSYQSYTSGYYQYYSTYYYDYVGYTSTFLPKTDFLVDAAACPKVKNLKAKDITINSAKVTWTPGAGEVSWTVVMSDSVKTDAQLAALADTLTYKLDTVFSGLTPDTDYHFYIRSLCSSALSDWKHFVFTTLPTCAAPIELSVENVADTAATLKWSNITEGFAGTYSVAIGKAATFNLAVDSTFTLYEGVADSMLTVNGLKALTSYKFAVMEACSATDSSRWSSPYTFTTECGAYETPWTEDFENAVMTCWSLDDGVSVQTASTYSKSGTHALRFNKTNDTVLAVLPMFDRELPELEFAYSWRCEGSGSTTTMGFLEAGYVTDANDASTFVCVMNHPEHVFEYQDVEIVFPNTVPAGARLAFRYSGQTSNWYLFVDDIAVHEKPNCAKPVLSVQSVALNAVTISLGAEGDYILEIAETNDFATLIDSVMVSGVEEYTFNNLVPSTRYFVRAKTVCGEGLESDWSSALQAKTLISIPYSEDFSAGKPADWSYYTGLAADAFAGTPLTSTTSGWTLQSSSVPAGMDDNMKLNIFGTSCRYWMVTPTIDVTDTTLQNIRLTFDAAWTKYNSTSAPIETSTDDKFMVAVSTDGGNTWNQNNAYIWANDGTGNMGLVDDFSNRATKTNIDLSAYVGGSITIGFYGESTVSGGDNDFHVDNVVINTFNATCLDVENLEVSDITVNSATVDFDFAGGITNAVAVVEVSKTATFASLVASDTLTNASTLALTNLSASTTYYVRVKQLCDEGEESAYTSTSFTTRYGVRYAPVFASTSASTTEWKSATSGVTAEDAVSNGAGLVTLNGWSLTTTAISDVHFKANVYGSSSHKWLVSPSIDLSPNTSDGIVLYFDAALTKWNVSTKPNGDMEDDRMVVLACVDDSTWFKVAEWNNLGTGDYVYADIDSVATPYQLNLTEFAGQSNVRVAFYGESTVAGDDNDLHVANIVVDRAEATSYSGDVCEGNDYDGISEGNPFYISASDYVLGENHYSMVRNDSIFILNLMVHASSTYEYDVTVCEGQSYHDENFNFDVITLSTPTEQKRKGLKNVNGCDSVIIMHLTIYPVARVNEARTICPGKSFVWNGQTISTVGNYTATLKTVNDCDSVITLTVTWDQIGDVEEYRSAFLCEGDQLELSDGRVITQTGHYKEETVRLSGCDSTVYWTVVTVAEDGNFYDEVLVKDLPYVVNGEVVVEEGAKPGTQPAYPIETSCGTDAALIVTVIDDTAVENITGDEHAVKVFVDDKLIIIRNGVKYSATGARLD